MSTSPSADLGTPFTVGSRKIVQVETAVVLIEGIDRDKHCGKF
jgi:hypothetical protein